LLGFEQIVKKHIKPFYKNKGGSWRL